MIVKQVNWDEALIRMGNGEDVFIFYHAKGEDHRSVVNNLTAMPMRKIAAIKTSGTDYALIVEEQSVKLTEDANGI